MIIRHRKLTAPELDEFIRSHADPRKEITDKIILALAVPFMLSVPLLWLLEKAGIAFTKQVNIYIMVGMSVLSALSYTIFKLRKQYRTIRSLKIAGENIAIYDFDILAYAKEENPKTEYTGYICTTTEGETVIFSTMVSFRKLKSHIQLEVVTLDKAHPMQNKIVLGLKTDNTHTDVPIVRKKADPVIFEKYDSNFQVVNQDLLADAPLILKRY